MLEPYKNAAETNDFSRRLRTSKVIICVCFSLIAGRLWYLQCLNGSYYRNKSENNRTRTIRTTAPRGNIFDRNGQVLVRNRPAFDVSLLLEDTPSTDDSVARIAEMTNRDITQVRASFQSRKKGRPFEPKLVLADVSREELARVKVNSYRLPGVIVKAIPTRVYPNVAAGAQVLGYVREISKSQLERRPAEGYSPGDSIGQSGLELHYEEFLRGESGYVQVEVDARGRRVGELGIVDDRPGNDIYLTIDLDLQLVAEKALREHKGALVALDPRNGEVLAIASTPTFDANIFSGHVRPEDWEKLSSDQGKPLNNRSIASIYPPGSTLKLLYAVAGLAEKVITPETRINCPGYYSLGRRRYHCHKRAGHGFVNLREAIRGSCNAYFYTLGQELGIDKIHKYLVNFGFGKRTGIALPGEEPGMAPSVGWKREKTGERWYRGDTIAVSIGQGYVVATPLQLASMMATIANGGTVYRPRLLYSMTDSKTEEEELMVSRVLGKVSVDKKIFASVRSYAADVVNHEHGTGNAAKLPGIVVGGKTGTAQVTRIIHGGAKNDRTKDHAWFVAFAPVEDPSIALAVIVENSGHGGTFAAPVAQKVLAKHFQKLGMIAEDAIVEETGGAVHASVSDSGQSDLGDGEVEVSETGESVFEELGSESRHAEDSA